MKIKVTNRPEKEDQRDLHIPKEYWPFESSFDYLGTPFEAKLSRLEDRNISKNPLESELEVKRVVDEMSFIFFCKASRRKSFFLFRHQIQSL